MDLKGQKIFKLEGKVQQYAWGGANFIASLLNKPEGGTQAEYWLGAHASAPSRILSKETYALNELLKVQSDLLGENVRHEFGRLPYLLKVLDVKDMLSIQVHPAKKAAETAFAREQAAGIPITATNRNYKDDNHKPELMLAIGDFWLLHGFKPEKRLRAKLDEVAELNFLSNEFVAGGYSQLYRTVMLMEQNEVNSRLKPLLDRIIPMYKAEQLKKSSEHFWAARAALTFNKGEQIDRGIFSIYLLNLVSLKNGEAIFQDAGILHAYLEGQNIEIMANSDNVLRGGLTPKHIDVEELMQHVVFEGIEPFVIHPKPELNGEEVYNTPARDFELSRFRLEANEQTEFTTSTSDIILLMEGSLDLREGEQTINLKKGEAALVLPGEVHLKAGDKSLLFRATTPVHRP